MSLLFANASAGLIGLLFFFIIFVGIVVWAYMPANRERLEAHGRIPLDDTEYDKEGPRA